MSGAGAFPLRRSKPRGGIVVLAGAIAITFPFAGAVFLHTVGAYALGRLVLESWREQQDRAFGIRVNGFISMAFVTLALAAAFATVWRP